MQKDLLSSIADRPSSKKERYTLDAVKEKIVANLRDHGEMSSTDLARSIGYSRPTPLLTLAIRELIESEAIAYLIPDKPTSKNQKLKIAEQ